MIQLFSYIALGLVLVVADVRYGYLNFFRQTFALLTYPVQMAATKPAGFISNAERYFSDLVQVQRDNAALRRAQLGLAERLLRQDVLEEENRQLRALLDMREAVAVKTVAADVLFSSRDPFSRRVVLDKGSLQGVEPGQVVIDEIGIVGQVVRVDPVQCEVNLITDRAVSVPVRSLRSGVRGVLSGAGEGRLEMKFVSADADIKVGDRLVTSGLDGLYIAGLPVAEVQEVRRGEEAFAVIVARPLALVEHAEHLLILDRAKTMEQKNPLETPPKNAKTPAREETLRSPVGAKRASPRARRTESP